MQYLLTVRSVQCQCYNANEMRHLIQYTLCRKSVIKQQNRVDIQQLQRKIGQQLIRSDYYLIKNCTIWPLILEHGKFEKCR